MSGQHLLQQCGPGAEHPTDENRIMGTTLKSRKPFIIALRHYLAENSFCVFLPVRKPAYQEHCHWKNVARLLQSYPIVHMPCQARTANRCVTASTLHDQFCQQRVVFPDKRGVGKTRQALSFAGSIFRHCSKLRPRHSRSPACSSRCPG